MTMFRTKKTAQQQWDESIEEARDSAATDLRHAALLEDFSCFRWAAGKRTRAAESTRVADRMTTCPHNPRNGGAGWKPSPGFWDVFTVRDIAAAGLWLAINLTVGITVMLGVVHVIIGRGHYLPADSPGSMLVPLKAAAAGLWAVIVTTWVMNAVLDATALATRYVRGAAK